MYVNDYAAVMEMNASERVNICICVLVTVHAYTYIVYNVTCLESAGFVS